MDGSAYLAGSKILSKGTDIASPKIQREGNSALPAGNFGDEDYLRPNDAGQLIVGLHHDAHHLAGAERSAGGYT
jgi:hypothetical protein